MVTMVGTEKNLDDLLKDLISLDFDAAEAYGAAIERLDNASYKEALIRFREDHLRHTSELGQFLSARGIKPPQGGDMKQLLTKGKVVIASLMGDTAILNAMLSNEGDTNTAYERAVSNAAATPDVIRILQKNLEDERKHKHWIENAIKLQKST